MDIDYVNPGDTVRASTINGLIDGIGGLLVPSEDF